MKKEIKKKTKQLDETPQPGIGQKRLDELHEYIETTYKSVREMPARLQDYASSLNIEPAQPTLTSAVLNTMEILVSVGLWEEWERGNSTTYMAVKALDAYNKMLKRISQYRSAERSADKAFYEWLYGEKNLVENLFLKGLNPLGGTASDPLRWYRPTSEFLQMYKDYSGRTLGQRALNKYQALEFIPPPIRMGKQTYRSILTFIFLEVIEMVKGRGIKLPASKMREAVNLEVNEFISLANDPSLPDYLGVRSVMNMINKQKETFVIDTYRFAEEMEKETKEQK